jgi:hypothetical protein
MKIFTIESSRLPAQLCHGFQRLIEVPPSPLGRGFLKLFFAKFAILSSNLNQAKEARTCYEI